MAQKEARKKSELSMNPRIERDREMIIEARKKGKGALAGVFVRLSGPGWLQSAITLGGGSLSSSMYLGVLGGFAFLWLQPLAMIAGIIMLSAISYVTLSTDETPLKAINRHVNPVLGWGWLFASMAANIVWSIPQYSLGMAALRQNLFTGILGESGLLGGAGVYVAAAIILGVALSAGMLYSVGGRGVKIFETLVKIMVGMTVLSFIAVVVRLVATGQIVLGNILGGFVFHPRLLTEPVQAFSDQIAAVVPAFQSFWSDMIVGQQRDVMISAGATAVGINMTFLLPYSMLRKGWDRDFRGLAIFDLSTGLFFPFLLATSCVVVASASQFHAEPAEGFVPLTEEQTMNEMGQVIDADGNVIEPHVDLVGRYKALMRDRIMAEGAAEVFTKIPEERREHVVARINAALVTLADEENLQRRLEAEETGGVATDMESITFDTVSLTPLYTDIGMMLLSDKGQEVFLNALIPEMAEADRRMAAMLVKRDAFNLSSALAPITGDRFAKYVFGLGVLGMAMGASTMLMLINGLCFSALLDVPAKGWQQRVGMLMPAVAIFAPLFWEEALMWLAVPTSVFCMTLLPFAYLSFFLLMNQRKYLGKDAPIGPKRVLWNVLMAFSTILACVGAFYSIYSRLGMNGAVAVVGGFVILLIIGHFFREKVEIEVAP
ncbi:MAG: divalent metal cation transporter [Candidatus Hydrogenedentota bacterium]